MGFETALMVSPILGAEGNKEFLLEKEVETINKVMKSPEQPLVAVIGGAKIADKIEVLNKLIDMADRALRMSLIEEFAGRIVLRDPCCRILLERVGPKRFAIFVDAALLPGETTSIMATMPSPLTW